MRERGAGKKRADESQYQGAFFHYSIPRSIGGRLLRNAAVQATEFERSIVPFLNGARLLANFVGDRPQKFRSRVADQTIADAVVRPGEAPDVALRLRRHWRVLIRTAHRASQHDNPTAVVIIVHEHRGRAVLGGNQAPSHQPVA